MQLFKTCIGLKDLPPPTPEKIGWPWTKQSGQLSEKRPDGSEWPRITIVTPSYNQGEFIEETIRSVLLQNYPNLEYIIIDGGSTDNTLEIIKKYQPWLTYWQSQKDKGQSDAINQGFALSTGQIMAWINSDDLLAADALYHVGIYYQRGLNWWNGGASQIVEDGSFICQDFKQVSLVSRQQLLYARMIICQVATFWNRELWEKTGAFLSQLDLAMDYELWLRFSEWSSAISIPQTLGILRKHKHAKTGTYNGYSFYLKQCDEVRLQEFKKQGVSPLIRVILINFWTRYYLAKSYGWKSWVGKRVIPFV